MATELKTRDLLCMVTGRPFYPIERRDGRIVCSECGKVFLIAPVPRAP